MFIKLGEKEYSLIGIFDFDRKTKVQYIIKTVLELTNRWKKIKIIVVKNE